MVAQGIHIYIYTHTHINPSVYPYIHPSIHPSIHPPMHACMLVHLCKSLCCLCRHIHSTLVKCTNNVVCGKVALQQLAALVTSYSSLMPVQLVILDQLPHRFLDFDSHRRSHSTSSGFQRSQAVKRRSANAAAFVGTCAPGHASTAVSPMNLAVST